MITYTRPEWQHIRNLVVILEDMAPRHLRTPDRLKHERLCKRLMALLDGEETVAAGPTLFDRNGGDR